MLSHKHISVNIYLVPDKVSPLKGWRVEVLKRTQGFKIFLMISLKAVF